MMSVQANTGPKWSNKTTKAFWRGRDSRRERLDLVKLSRRQPELIDAALTNFFFFRDEEKEYGPKVKHVSFFDFFKVSALAHFYPPPAVSQCVFHRDTIAMVFPGPCDQGHQGTSKGNDQGALRQ